MDKNKKVPMYINIIFLLAGGMFVISGIIDNEIIFRVIYGICGIMMLFSGVIGILRLKK
jgi:hypothetical protein